MRRAWMTVMAVAALTMALAAAPSRVEAQDGTAAEASSQPAPLADLQDRYDEIGFGGPIALMSVGTAGAFGFAAGAWVSGFDACTLSDADSSCQHRRRALVSTFGTLAAVSAVLAVTGITLTITRNLELARLRHEMQAAHSARDPGAMTLTLSPFGARLRW